MAQLHEIAHALHAAPLDRRVACALFAHEVRMRIGGARVEKASLVRQHIHVDTYLPLDRRASGHVLRALSGE